MKPTFSLTRRAVFLIAGIGILSVGALLTAFRSSRAESVIRLEPTPRRVANGSDPNLAIRDTGDIYLMKFESGNLWYEVSADGGDTFGHGVRVNDVDGEVVSHAEATPRLNLRGGRPFALWQAHTDRDSMKLRFARSMDYGKSFGKAIDVDPAGHASQSFFNLNVSPKGTIYVVWLDGRDKSAGHAGHSEHGGSALYLARSTDGGATFEPSIRVAGNVCPCCRPSIAFTDENTVHVAFRQVFDGNVRDIAVATSSDGGKSWAQPARVAEDNWQINGCPHSGPSLAVLGNRLFVSWFTVHEKEQQSYIFLAHSDDRGRTFSHSASLSEGSVDPNHPYLIAGRDRLFAVFQARDRDTNGGWGKVRVCLREVNADGRLSRLVTVANLAASAYYPTVAFESPDKVLLAWTESGETAGHIVVIRGRLAGAGM